MDFLGAHRAKILDRIYIPSWRNAKRGTIVLCQYKKENRSELKLYLILDVKSFNREHLLHVLDLKYINPSILESRLIKHTVHKLPLEESFRGKTYTLLEFNKGEKVLYSSTIKALVNDGFAHSYRTIDPTKMSSIQLICYKWKDNKNKEDQGISKKEYQVLQDKVPGTQDISHQFRKEQEKK